MLSAIDSLIEATCAGHGGVLVLEGDPGAGKTVLLAEAARRCRAKAMQVCAAQGGELEQRLPWGVARDLLGPTVGRGTRQARPTGVAARALGLSAEQPRPAEIDADPDTDLAAAYALTELSRDLAEALPTAFLIDDAHWCDPCRGGGSPTSRPGCRTHRCCFWSLRERRAVLGPQTLPLWLPSTACACQALPLLSPEGSSAIVRGALPGATASLCVACATASGGNPFLLTALVAELARRSNDPSPDTVYRRQHRSYRPDRSAPPVRRRSPSTPPRPDGRDVGRRGVHRRCGGHRRLGYHRNTPGAGCAAGGGPPANSREGAAGVPPSSAALRCLPRHPHR